MASSDGVAVPVPDQVLRSMTDSIAHRGPDSAGHHVEDGVSLGMRRLSIIDVEGGAQPLANEDQTVWTVFNGEIYNFPELRADLAARGHVLSSRGDTETIVHLYEEHGVDFPKRLRGMFGAAVWDRARRRLVLTRDRMGVKPLYYAETPGGLAFASEVKCLIAGGLIQPALDPLAAELFMAYGYVPGPRTLFAGVKKLPPATTLTWEKGRIVDQRTYWTAWDDAPAMAGSGWQAQQEQLLELLRRSVRARMISEVPVGVMLSGGLDSSLITALMAEVSSHPVQTFSIGFAESPAANELADAQRVASRLGTDHHPLLTSAVDHPGLLDDAMWHLEEPIADLSFLGFLLLSQLAREHVTVALSGQGADELLAGYTKHAIGWGADRFPELPAALRAKADRLLLDRAEAAPWARGIAAITTSDPVARQLAMSRVVGSEQRRQLFSDTFRQPGAEREIAAAVLDRLDARAGSTLSQVLDLDRKMALVDLMFLYFDKMSMAASLEVRVPFMDHDVVAFCAALPDDRKVWRGHRKEILRRLSAGLVDESVLKKPKRAFFVGALGAWLEAHRENLFREVLLDDRTIQRGYFQPDRVAKLVASAGTDGRQASRQLLSLLLLEKWHRMFVDPDGPARRMTVAGDS